jgi:hypothetical protein
VRRLLFPAVGVSIVHLLSALPAEACRCALAPLPCAAFQESDVVFAGRVVSIDTIQLSGDDSDMMRVDFAVLEAFRGVESTMVSLINGPGDCAFDFEAGESYVVYGRRWDKSPLPLTGLCTRTRLLISAADDLAYLRGRTAVPPGATVRAAGSVHRLDRDIVKSTTTRVPLRGIPITFIGSGKTYRTVTSNTGDFLIFGLPPGAYRVEAALPDTLSPHRPVQIDLRDPQGCGTIALFGEFDGRVPGRVVDAAGEGVPGLALELVPEPLRGRRSGMMHIVARSGADGRFEFTGVPPGVYFMRNERLYFPGVNSAARAATITVGPGERVPVSDFMLPEQVPLVVVNGTVKDHDGSPVAGAAVTVTDKAEGAEVFTPPAFTDARGRFAITLTRGVRYFITVDPQPQGSPIRATSGRAVSVAFTPTDSARTLSVALRRASE